MGLGDVFVIFSVLGAEFILGLVPLPFVFLSDLPLSFLKA
jgi:hypothetical protein